MTDDYCLCDECRYADAKTESCKLGCVQFGYQVSELVNECYEYYVEQQMKKGLSREEAENEVELLDKYRELDYCPRHKPPVDDYEPYEDYLIRRGEMEREERAIEEMEKQK